ncbi:MAG TPA: triose-phosphate isomerase [Candidatus Eisenbacteria bacterium]|jgi:triosephosphate isomerase|nr:triose-phosphate isomerase [Candidatus Eisenbacteria bacterium]
MKRILAGNWKMNLGVAEAKALFAAVAGGARRHESVSFLVFPPATALYALAGVRQSGDPRLGAQNCHPEPKGAFTGEISSEQAKEAGAEFLLVGHSERRRLFCESDALVRQKLQAAWRAGLTPVLCVGETLAERERRETRDVLGRQIRRALDGASPRAPLLLAYEPVWAIGTGVVASTEEVAEAHGWVQEEIAAAGRSGHPETPVLYGGSVDPKNSLALGKIEAVGGFLVGGASLKEESFLAIAGALEAQRTPH